MSIGLAFWVIMLIWFIFWLVSYWPGSAIGVYGPIGHGLMLFVLLGLLGWHAFGPPLHG